MHVYDSLEMNREKNRAHLRQFLETENGGRECPELKCTQATQDLLAFLMPGPRGIQKG